MELHSQSFDDGATIPGGYTCDGEDRSPQIAWSGAPEGARGFVLIVDDPDAPGGTFAHWGLFDIPAEVTELPEGFSAAPALPGVKQATNDFERVGWGGPCPPPGHGVHHYRFRLLALDVAQLDMPAGVHCREVERAADPHVVGRTELVGLYER